MAQIIYIDFQKKQKIKTELKFQLLNISMDDFINMSIDDKVDMRFKLSSHYQEGISKFQSFAESHNKKMNDIVNDLNIINEYFEANGIYLDEYDDE